VRTLLAYVLVLPFSFFASGLAAIVVAAAIAFAFIRTSVWLRSTIAGFVGCVGGGTAAVATGWYIFAWIVGPGSFTLGPFIASVSLRAILIPRYFRQAKDQARTRAELQASELRWWANEIGNPWSTVVGDVVGISLATAWFLMA